MAGAKKAAAAPAAPAAPAELLVMVAREPVKYGGKRHQPGEALLALPDDVDGLIAAGLAEIDGTPEAPQV